MDQPNLSSILSTEIILTRLERIYCYAVKDRKWNVALQAVIMQGRHINMFKKQTLPVVARIKDMTEEQIDDFIDYLEKNDPELKPKEEASQETPEEASGKI